MRFAWLRIHPIHVLCLILLVALSTVLVKRDPNEMVAERRLTKLQDGKKPVTADVQSTYSNSQRKRHAHFVSQQSDAAGLLSPSEAERAISGRARQVILSLRAGDVARLSTFVDPQKGVRFSPYASVLPDEDRVIKRNQLVQMWASKKRYKWGAYDGSGDPIWLTFKKYYRRFIFDHDFSRAKRIAYNPEVMSHGNTPNNIREYYPKAIAIEYYFPGFDTKLSGMDWISLWLVFEKRGSEWYLVGIVHDEWTI